MTDLLQMIEIELPKSVERDLLDEIKASIATMDGVEKTGESSYMSVDPESIKLWFELASQAFATVGAAITVIKGIRDLLRSRNIKGAKVALANGQVIPLDEISQADLEKLESGK